MRRNAVSRAWQKEDKKKRRDMKNDWRQNSNEK